LTKEATEGNQLTRKLGLFPVSSIVVANMIGAGIFTTSGLLMKDLLHPGVMLGLWVIGGLIALCGALSYGELGAAMPRAGGEYVFLSRLFHPVIGFLSGWVSFFVGFSAPIAASAIGFSEYLARAWPEFFRPGLLPAESEPAILKKACAILVIFGFTYLHTRGLELGAKIQNALTVLKVGLIVILVAAGLFSGKGDPANFVAAGEYTLDFGGVKTLGLALMWIMFAYSGWNASAYIGSEIKDPEKNLPRSLIIGTGIVVVLYLGLNAFYVYSLSPAEMAGVISIGGLAAGKLFGTAAECVISVMIAFALFSSLSAFVIIGPRVYYAMARDGVFFRSMAKVDARHGVPSRSIWLQGAIAVVMVLFGTFDQLLTYMGFSLGIFPILAVIGLFKLRRSGLGRIKLPGFPLAPAIYIVFGTLILVLSFLERPVESSIAAATVLIGIPVYVLFKKYGAG